MIRHTRNNAKASSLAAAYFETRPMSDKKRPEFLKKFITNHVFVHRLVRHFEILDQVFPDMWDIHLGTIYRRYSGGFRANSDAFNPEDRYDTTYLSIRMHMPEVTVTNDQIPPKSVLIRDLFLEISWYIEPTTVEFNSPSGLVATRTLGMWNSQYGHSHLPSYSKGEIPYFKTFCLGSGEFAKMNVKFQESPYEYDMNQFKMYLLQFKSIVRQESTAGGPHILMRGISERGYSSLPYLSLRHQKELLTRLENNGTSFESLDMVVEDNKIRIVDNGKLDALALPVALEHHKAKLIDNRYVGLQHRSINTSRLDRVQGKELFKFRGKMITNNITMPDINGQRPEDFPDVLHPEAKKYVFKELSTRATRNYHKAFITSNGKQYSTEGSDNRPSLQARNALVSKDTES